MSSVLSLPKFFYSLHFKDGTSRVIACKEEKNWLQIKASGMIVGGDGLDIIEMLDPSTLARVERIRPEDREADNSRAYCNRLVGPIKAVGELRLEKYEAVKGKKMPLFEFKKWIDSFNQNRRKRELDGDIVYSKCYRENGGN